MQADVFGELLLPAAWRRRLQLTHSVRGHAPGGERIVALECHPGFPVLADGIDKDHRHAPRWLAVAQLREEGRARGEGRRRRRGLAKLCLAGGRTRHGGGAVDVEDGAPGAGTTEVVKL